MTDEEMQMMPWTRDLMTSEEMRQWVASREEAGLKIDIETCELGCWYVDECDPYGLRERKDGFARNLSVNKCNFVRSAESNGWVCWFDLPRDKAEARGQHRRPSRQLRARP